MLFVFGLLFTGGILLWLACPLWLPWVLRPIARSAGLRYSEYHRKGYARFEITNARLRSSGLQLNAGRVEALVPTVWLWNLAAGNTSGPRPFFLADGWHYESTAPSEANPSTDRELRKLQAQLSTLARWLPSAALTNGTVLVQDRPVTIRYIVWSRDRLVALASLPGVASDLRVEGQWSGASQIRLLVQSPQLNLASENKLITTPSGTDLHSTNRWDGSPVEVHAHFARMGSLPETASLSARKLSVPAEALGISGYRDLAGSISGSWAQGRFAVSLEATATPTSPNQLPTVDMDLTARGDTNSVAIEKLNLNSPFLRAEISRPAVIAFKGPILRQPVELNVSADLARQSFYPLEGTLRGTADFIPTLGVLPAVRFHLSGSNVGDREVKASRLKVEAQFTRPWLVVEEARAEFKDGSVSSFSGKLDVDKKVVAGGHFQLAGPVLRRWLPPGCSYQALSVSGDLEGTLAEPKHSGELEVKGFVSPELQPLRVQGKWRGTKANLDDVELSVASTNSLLAAKGSLSVSAEQTLLELGTLTLSTNNRPVLQLTRPVSVSADHRAGSSGWHVETTPIQWAGEGHEVSAQASLDWPSRGLVQLTLQNLSPELAAGFLKQQLPQLDVLKLEASAAWTNRPVVFSVRGKVKAMEPGLDLSSAEVRKPEGKKNGSEKAATVLSTNHAAPLVLTADLDVSGNEKGINVSNLVVSSGASNVVVVHGVLPILLDPAGGTNLARLDLHAPLQVVATAQPEAFFWNELGTYAGLILSDPELKVDLSGSWAAPSGAVELHAAKMKLKSAPPTVPELEDVHFALHLNRSEAVLTQGELFIQGQPIELTGHIPLGEEFWQNLRQKKPPNLEQAMLRIQIRRAELAAFEPLFPTLLAPEGQLDVDLSVLPGAKLSGHMLVQNARTRPLGNLGPLRRINLRLEFLNRTVKLESARAEMSAAEVRLAGQGDLSGTQWLHGQLPPFTVSLYGTNVPLAREPEAVVRSDLALAVTKTNGAPPLITGLVELRDSFFLADLNALIPGKVTTVSRRPPYFSIEDPFVADWRLEIGVQGERFLKVRTPVFNGQISANLKVQGTLKDPIALGDLRINSGSVTFPFASLQVQQGLVNLTSQNPYHPQLSVSAASKQFGYDIRMDVTGPVDAPVIQFNSTPPLSSEQILLMVTAGQLPQGTFSLTPQQRAQTVAMFFGRDLLSKLGIGGQGEERLLVRSGEEISDEGRPTYHVEYKLSDRWSLVGEYDRFGDFNAGFKWRILSR